MIYLDHSATTPVDEEVLAAMAPTWREAFGNPASSHQAGARAATLLQRARVHVAAAMGADPVEIVFTSGGTEGDNLAVTGSWRAAGSRGRILFSAIEHPAVREPALSCAGADAQAIPVDGHGRVRLEELERMLRAGAPPALVSVMHASNEVGTLQPIAEIGRLCREFGAPFHVDAVQTVAQVALDVREINCDLVTITAHKIYGPKGVGALYVRRGTKIAPLFHGGGQEGGARPGTLNVSGAVGLGAACQRAIARRRDTTGLTQLRRRLLTGLQEVFPDLVILGAPEARLPGHLSVAAPGLDSRELVMHLDAMGIAISRGSACHAGTDLPSLTLQAMGIDARTARGAMRFSLGSATTAAEIDETIACARRFKQTNPL